MARNRDWQANYAKPRLITARRAAVISSPDLGVFAVTAAGVLCAFPTSWMHYLNSVSAADLVLTSLSLLFFLN
jgi:hypothetical protein